MCPLAAQESSIGPVSKTNIIYCIPIHLAWIISFISHNSLRRERSPFKGHLPFETTLSSLTLRRPMVNHPYYGRTGFEPRQSDPDYTFLTSGRIISAALSNCKWNWTNGFQTLNTSCIHWGMSSGTQGQWSILWKMSHKEWVSPREWSGFGREKTSLILGLSYRGCPGLGKEGHLLKQHWLPNVLVTETSPYLLVPSNLLKRVA